MLQGGHAWLYFPLEIPTTQQESLLSCPLSLLSHYYTIKENTAIKY